MPTNTIAGVNLAQIAQESLPALQSCFGPIKALMTDFSSDINNVGASVATRYPTKPTAADMASGYETAAGNSAMTAVTVTLNTHYGWTWGFNDVERAKSAINLNTLFIEPALQAIGTKVFGDIWNLVTEANFTTESVITAANFDREDLADIAAILTNTLKAPKMGRSVFANPTHHASLVKTLNDAEFPGSIEEKREGRVPRTAGFDIYETDLADENAQNLQAFAFHRSALAFAGRVVGTDPEGRDLASRAGIELEVVEVPGLGLPVQWRRWYSSDGILYYNINLLYGVAKGTGMGVRIPDA